MRRINIGRGTGIFINGKQGGVHSLYTQSTNNDNMEKPTSVHYRSGSTHARSLLQRPPAPHALCWGRGPFLWNNLRAGMRSMLANVLLWSSYGTEPVPGHRFVAVLQPIEDFRLDGAGVFPCLSVRRVLCYQLLLLIRLIIKINKDSSRSLIRRLLPRSPSS